MNEDSYKAFPQETRLTPEIPQLQHNPDNSIVCHIGLSGIRKHTSFRCDTKVWQAFKKVCLANGLSTCDILEKLLLGFSVGYSTRVAQPTTIYVSVDAPRVVKRVRRRKIEFEDMTEYREVTPAESKRIEAPKIVTHTISIDYGKLSLGELRKRYERANHGARQIIAYWLKRKETSV